MVWPFSKKGAMANGVPPYAQFTPLDPMAAKKGRSFRTVSLALGMLLCLLAIMMPTTCDDTYLPSLLQLAVHQKMIAAYVLGLLTMGIVAYH